MWDLYVYVVVWAPTFSRGYEPSEDYKRNVEVRILLLARKWFGVCSKSKARGFQRHSGEQHDD